MKNSPLRRSLRTLAEQGVAILYAILSVILSTFNDHFLEEKKAVTSDCNALQIGAIRDNKLAVMSARNGRVHSSQLLFRKGFQA